MLGADFPIPLLVGQTHYDPKHLTHSKKLIGSPQSTLEELNFGLSLELRRREVDTN